MEASNYTPAEEERIVQAVRSGRAPLCPRCGATMASTDVPPRPEVAYVRRRRWMLCSGCRRSFVVDHRRLE